MPELPEVETVRRGLAPHLEGHKLARVNLYRENLRKPFPEGFAKNLTGRRILDVGRRAKYLLIRLEGGLVLLSHLGMSGRFRIFEDTPPDLEKHDHVEWLTDQGVTIRYNDPRRFGSMSLIEESALETYPAIAALGPEPLGNSFNAPQLSAALKNKKCSIKDALMDQRVVAGLGNIYVCESLFRAGISPKRKASTVAGKRAGILTPAIRDILNEAIEAGGSSLKDHRQTNGEMGYFQHAFQVYGREGEICPTCLKESDDSRLIKRIVQSGRSTFYCAKCQG